MTLQLRRTREDRIIAARGFLFDRFGNRLRDAGALQDAFGAGLFSDSLDAFELLIELRRGVGTSRRGSAKYRDARIVMTREAGRQMHRQVRMRPAAAEHQQLRALAAE